MIAAADPRWDMSVVFPSLESSEFSEAFACLQSDLDDLEALYSKHGVGFGGVVDIVSFETLVHATNRVYERFETLSAYISAFVTTDSRNDLALARESEMDAEQARVRKVLTQLTAWFGSADIDGLLRGSELARTHEYALRHAVDAARHLMSPELENLASDLELTGVIAWEKLYASVTSQIVVAVEVRGEPQTMPMSAVRALSSDPDRSVRQNAYEAELAAWHDNQTPIAAALNAIKGTVVEVSSRRNWGSPLDAALHDSHIDRAALEAMMEAARESFTDFRRYLRAKAHALGLPRLAWFDIFAPLGAETRQWNYDEATEFVARHFDGYSQKMGDFARRSFRERWIDVYPRPGKVDGAFCMGIRSDESRILLNFKPAFGAVSTLAHELGHGYHNLCLAGRTPLQQDTPMTLAETASIFCETIIRHASLKEGTPQDQLAILEASIQGSCQVVVDISSRFMFESSVFEARSKRELSSAEFKEAMLKAQLATYGDGLDPAALHPYMWAAKGHYYSGQSFYNFPYMFGLLFGLGLYSVYEREGESFLPRYDNLLSSTGLADAGTLAAEFGIDIRTVEFWRSSLDQIRGDIDQFARLVGYTDAAG